MWPQWRKGAMTQTHEAIGARGEGRGKCLCVASRCGDIPFYYGASSERDKSSSKLIKGVQDIDYVIQSAIIMVSTHLHVFVLGGCWVDCSCSTHSLLSYIPACIGLFVPALLGMPAHLAFRLILLISLDLSSFAAI